MIGDRVFRKVQRQLRKEACPHQDAPHFDVLPQIAEEKGGGSPGGERNHAAMPIEVEI